jgi:hypothetical protein
MKYKEAFGITRFGYTPFRIEDVIICLYRHDPVPCTGSKWNWKYYRTPKTSNLKRDDSKYNRGKRRKKEIWDKWEDDYPRADQFDRSWKRSTKRKRQFK